MPGCRRLQRTPAASARSGELLKLCAAKRLLVLVAGKNVLRLAPALNITDEEMNAGLDLLEEAVREFTGRS